MEGSTEKEFDDTLDLTVRDAVEDDRSIFATELGDYRDESFCGRGGDLVADWAGTDEGDVADGGVAC